MEEEKELIPTKNKNNIFIWYGLFLVILAIFIIGISNLNKLSVSSDVRDESYYNGMAMYVIKENLKDPKSAEFLKVKSELLNNGEDGAFVALEVRAKNSFNAHTIQKYLVEFDKYDNYKIYPVE